MATPVKYDARREAKKVERLAVKLRKLVENQLRGLESSEGTVSAAHLDSAVKSLRGLVGLQSDINRAKREAHQEAKHEQETRETAAKLPFPQRKTPVEPEPEPEEVVLPFSKGKPVNANVTTTQQPEVPFKV